MEDRAVSGHRAINVDRAPAGVLSALERAIVNCFQHGFPRVPRPYAAIGAEVGCSEAEALAAVRSLSARGVLQRVGAVVRSGSVGCSTLAAMRVPPERLAEIAAFVSTVPEVNHNYEREHELNLWFVVAAPNEARLGAVLEEISGATGIEVLDLRLVEAYHVDLGFHV
jgi:DNA-binding Lrp family transcriptional regulator